ncbi:MAG: hypothetical protein NC418_01575 [Muribaculaceae bacterium]|nr:hypothetical protein [Muribaculaceae bacterium]
MKKLSTYALGLALLLPALTAQRSFAISQTVLETPIDVLSYSVADESDRVAYENALNAATTDDEKIAAMQAYVLKATPEPGYAFDLSFLVHYNALTTDNKDLYTATKMSEYWHTEADVEMTSTIGLGTGAQYMRVLNNAKAFNTDAMMEGLFVVYQNVELNQGKYTVEADAYVGGLKNGAVLAAGNNVSSTKLLGVNDNPKQHSLAFEVLADDAQPTKIGFKRTSTIGNLTTVFFNNIHLYKTSNIAVITDDATEGLAAANNMNVIMEREFTAGKYYPIVLPFIVENWREVFDDCRALTSYTEEGGLVFNTVAGANTLARKPYLVKFKEDITSDNYITFKNVEITSGTPGTWNFTYTTLKMTGTWAAANVPANCYYFSDGKWLLSDGSISTVAFSSYIDATGIENLPEEMKWNSDAGSSDVTIVESVIGETVEYVNVYSLQGVLLRKGVHINSALDELPSGLYIVNGKKIVK